MQLTGNLMIGFGGLLGFIGFVMIWVPFLGLFCLIVGFGLFVGGQYLKRLGRHDAVLRKQGGRGLL